MNLSVAGVSSPARADPLHALRTNLELGDTARRAHGHPGVREAKEKSSSRTPPPGFPGIAARCHAVGGRSRQQSVI